MPVTESKKAFGGLKGRKNASVAPKYQVILPKYNDFDDSPASPDIDFIDLPIGGADVEDLGRRIADGVGDVVNDQGISDSQVVDITWAAAAAWAVAVSRSVELEPATREMVVARVMPTRSGLTAVPERGKAD
jgi:hypothetical protein